MMKRCAIVRATVRIGEHEGCDYRDREEGIEMEPITEFVEISDDLIAKIAQADKRIEELADQLRGAEHAKQNLLDDAVRDIATFTVGQEVLSYGKLYRVTKVQGTQFGLQGQRAKVWLHYFGERLKVNGEPMGRERQLYDATACD